MVWRWPVPDIMMIGIECDACGRKTKRSLRWVRKSDVHLCDCGITTPLESHVLKAHVDRVEQAFADFQLELRYAVIGCS